MSSFAAWWCSRAMTHASRSPRRSPAAEGTRGQESLKLLTSGYQCFDSIKLYGAGDAVKTLDVWKGAGKAVKVGFKQDLILAVPKGEAEKVKADLVSQQPLVAPVAE